MRNRKFEKKEKIQISDPAPAKKKGQCKGMKKRKWLTFVLLAVFFIGLAVLLYPSLSDYWNSLVQSKAIVDYEGSLKNVDTSKRDAMFAAAEEYNASLADLESPYRDHNSVKGYDTMLDLNGTGMMGYVTIEKIGIELPLYRGTTPEVLAIAVGHVRGTSLPIPGEAVHSVLSAHRGLPTAKLFTDLDKLELGDTFKVTVIDKTFTFEVDQIRIVNPDDTSLLAIEDGREYCTLLTCTPYGINTQRLLVRGVRVENANFKNVYITAEAYEIDTLIVTPIVALPILFVLMMIVLFKPVKKEDKI